MGKHHDKKFPNEDDAYRVARDELLDAEVELRAMTEKVAALRRTLPPGGKVKEDYVFDEVDLATGETREVSLSGLFDEGKDSLIVYGFMYGPDWETPCSSCTSITDSSNGIAPHVRAATNFVVVAKAPPEKLRALAEERGWSHIRLLSSHRSSFNLDYFSEVARDDGGREHHPMANVFVRRDGAIHHFWASETFWVRRGGHPRHVDPMWPLWNWLDLTPEGRGEHMPELSYD